MTLDEDVKKAVEVMRQGKGRCHLPPLQSGRRRVGVPPPSAGKVEDQLRRGGG